MTLTALYRHYSDDGTLLYVGITNDPIKRDKQHMASSDWRAMVARTLTVWHTDRTSAEAAERWAIQNENPLHNIRRDVGPLPTAPTDGWRKRMHDEIRGDGKSLRAVSIAAGMGAGYLHSILIDGKDPTLDNFLRVCDVIGSDPCAILVGRSVE